MVVALARTGCKALDRRSGSLEVPLWLSSRCVQVKTAPGGVVAPQIEPSLTVITNGVASSSSGAWRPPSPVVQSRSARGQCS